jgi:hypothetical protein
LGCARSIATIDGNTAPIHFTAKTQHAKKTRSNPSGGERYITFSREVARGVTDTETDSQKGKG